MHPPVLTYTAAEGAAKYRCAVSWTDAKGTVHTERMESATPEFDLAKIWDGMPTAGPFQVAAEALGSDGKVLAKTESKYQRIAPFKGPYRPAKCGYGESAQNRGVAVEEEAFRLRQFLSVPAPVVVHPYPDRVAVHGLTGLRGDSFLKYSSSRNSISPEYELQLGQMPP